MEKNLLMIVKYRGTSYYKSYCSRAITTDLVINDPTKTHDLTYSEEIIFMDSNSSPLLVQNQVNNPLCFVSQKVERFYNSADLNRNKTCLNILPETDCSFNRLKWELVATGNWINHLSGVLLFGAYDITKSYSIPCSRRDLAQLRLSGTTNYLKSEDYFAEYGNFFALYYFYSRSKYLAKDCESSLFLKFLEVID